MVGIFIRSRLKNLTDRNVRYQESWGIVWTIKWIRKENELPPSEDMSELTIFHYLRSGKGQIHRRKDAN